jgi:hypothetical protein
MVALVVVVDFGSCGRMVALVGVVALVVVVEGCMVALVEIVHVAGGRHGWGWGSLQLVGNGLAHP